MERSAGLEYVSRRPVYNTDSKLTRVPTQTTVSEGISILSPIVSVMHLSLLKSDTNHFVHYVTLAAVMKSGSIDGASLR